MRREICSGYKGVTGTATGIRARTMLQALRRGDLAGRKRSSFRDHLRTCEGLYSGRSPARRRRWWARPEVGLFGPLRCGLLAKAVNFAQVSCTKDCCAEVRRRYDALSAFSQ